MATSYTTALRLPVPQPLDPATIGAWGPLIDAAITLTDAAVASTAVVPVTSNPQSLTTANGASDQARPPVQQYTGTLSASTTINLPNLQKFGWAINLTTGGFNIVESAGSGTTATIPPDGYWWFRATDGIGDAILPNVGLGALKTAGTAAVGTALTVGTTVTINGSGVPPGLSSQVITIPNNTNYGMVDGGGTARNFAGMAGNNLLISNPGAGTMQFINQNNTQLLGQFDNVGNFYLTTNVTSAIHAGFNGAVWRPNQGWDINLNSTSLPTVAIGNSSGGNTTLVSFFAAGATNVGSISTAGSSTSYNTTSDATLKIDDGPIADPGRIIDRLKPRFFRWKATPSEESEPGFFAQQVYRVFPWAVTKGRGRRNSKTYQPWQMDNARLVPLLVAELQSLRRRVRELERCLSAR